jgi:hypothetical protein
VGVKTRQETLGVGLVDEVPVWDFVHEFQLTSLTITTRADKQQPSRRVVEFVQFEIVRGRDGEHYMEGFRVRFKEQRWQRIFNLGPEHSDNLAGGL